MELRRDAFQAIADPTRREIITLLADKPMNVNAVAEAFDISRPAVSKHLRILEECGLVCISQQGRERFCAVQLDELSIVAAWIEPYRRFWNQKLDSLERYLEQLQKQELKNQSQSNQTTNGTDLSNDY